MNPLLINVLVGVMGRIINHKKIHSKTNITTAVGVATGTGAYLTLVQSEDPVLQGAGAIAILISAVITLYKDSEDG